MKRFSWRFLLPFKYPAVESTITSHLPASLFLTTTLNQSTSLSCLIVTQKENEASLFFVSFAQHEVRWKFHCHVVMRRHAISPKWILNQMQKSDDYWSCFSEYVQTTISHQRNLREWKTQMVVKERNLTTIPLRMILDYLCTAQLDSLWTIW